ncbi:putative polysaccharide biosynthesis protein [Pseudomonas syringae pv. helianthi]|uniref:Putative polysaccharide biosynthesis protein n=1 Tax=Pseudomonas syringae pv. helianthi TaxID=251654 RepID=A0A0P9TID7_9PSED|nr:polysaccharide biosynthesis C-terminal domain-containing protein [Pseudomonas syringae group genomosp. 7]KPX40376.1 putative polysaccharide biosynthesis protein [Pseudomonas syringae pv. helianthi]UNB62503.1 polysaccharide biosynthesis C-terminal domain-containing protein [Pseudomonas syringae pv. helianthi]
MPAKMPLQGAPSFSLFSLLKKGSPLIVQWLSTIYGAAMSLGISIFLARSMGPDAFGAYTYIYVLAMFLALIQDAGIKTLLLRERTSPTAALEALNRVLPSQALLHLVISSAVLMLGCYLASRWLDGVSLAAAVFCFGAITLVTWLSSWFKGAGAFSKDAFFQVCARSLSALMILSSIAVFGLTPVAIFSAWGLGLLLTFVWFRRDLPELIRAPLMLPVWAYRSAFVFLLLDLLTTIYHRVDIVILHSVLGYVPQVGSYAVACRLIDGVMLLATPVALVMFRRMRHLAETPDGSIDFSRKAILFAFAIGALLAGGGWMSGGWGVGLLFGDAYLDETQPIMEWLSISLFFALPNFMLTQCAVATHRERFFLICAAFSLLMNVCLNVWLVPLHGALGAAWATVSSEAILTLCLVLGGMLATTRDTSAQ